MLSETYGSAVKRRCSYIMSASLAIALLATSFTSHTNVARGQSYRPHFQNFGNCAERWVPEDLGGGMRRVLAEMRECRESLRRLRPAKREPNRPTTGRVSVTEIGPVGGGSFSKAGFIFNGEDTRQIVLPGLRLFRSPNGGHDWSLITPISIVGGGAEMPLAVRQDPQNPQVLLAAMPDGLVYRSEDFGTAWTALEATSSFLAVDFAINPASSNVILFLDSTSGIWKSDDGGVTAEAQPDTGLPTLQFDPDGLDYIAYPEYTNIATTPADPNIVYVVLNEDDYGHYAPGIFKSIDGGQTFARLPGSWSHPEQVFPHPTNPNVLYVEDFLGSYPFNTPRIYRSIDGGASFDPVMTGAGEDQFRFVAFDAHNPSRVYIAGHAGFFQSTDGGSSFQRLGLTAEQTGVEATTASVDPTNPKVLYVNTSRGNFKSVNGGKTFESISNGWRSVVIADMAFGNESEPSLYVAAWDGIGILRTRTRGKSYGQIPHPIDPNHQTAWVSRLGISPTDPELIVAGTLGRGLFRTTNGGQSWTPSSVDTGHDQFHRITTQIAIDPTNPNNVYFAASMGVFSFGFPGFYRSTDGGSTFQRTTSEPLDKLGIDPINPGTIYAGVQFASNFAPLKSVDGGLSFSNGPIFHARFITKIVIDPIDPNNLYLAGEFQLTQDIFERHRLVRSTDGGVTYSAAGEGLLSVFDLVIDPQDSGRLYAWTSDGLFISTDQATSWTLLEGAEAFQTAGSLNNLSINPKRPNLLYLKGSTVVEVEIK
jgi:photosystem II stability/assembly factor-like uncharacterized protein